MSNIKIIPDTNVILAASIGENTLEFEELIGFNFLTELRKTTGQHEFYEECIQLFDLFHPSKCADGYLIPTVRLECFKVLCKAVHNVFYSSDKSYGERRGKNLKDENTLEDQRILDEVTLITDYFYEYKMKELFKKLNRFDQNYLERKENLDDVKIMSQNLCRCYVQWGKKQKDEIVRTNGKQIIQNVEQLREFVRIYASDDTGPNMTFNRSTTRDEKILAEVITLKKKLKDPDSRFFIASKDTRFFSPYHLDNTVTEEIRIQFGIICDEPGIISKRIKQSSL